MSIKHQPLSPTRALFRTQPKLQIENVEEQCYYCSIKQKFSLDGKAQKCLQHVQKEIENSFSSQNDSPSPTLPQQILECLDEAQQQLTEYWNNLNYYGQGNIEKVKRDLSPIVGAMSRIQQVLNKFPAEESSFIDSFDKPSNNKCKDDRFKVKSQKMILIQSPTNINDFFSEEQSTTDQIKQWMLHFHKILANRRIEDDQLPFEGQLDMKIFKQSMQRKFVTFISNYERYETKLKQSLQKLLFYMQKCETAVQQKVINEDITFIESLNKEEQNINQSHLGSISFLLTQALGIESLMAMIEPQK